LINLGTVNELSSKQRLKLSLNKPYTGSSSSLTLNKHYPISKLSLRTSQVWPGHVHVHSFILSNIDLYSSLVHLVVKPTQTCFFPSWVFKLSKLFCSPRSLFWKRKESGKGKLQNVMPGVKVFKKKSYTITLDLQLVCRCN